MSVLPADGQSLGVFAADPASSTGISNGGSVFGYTAYMQYDPTTEDLFVLLLNDDSRSPRSARERLAQHPPRCLTPPIFQDIQSTAGGRDVGVSEVDVLFASYRCHIRRRCVVKGA